MHFKYEKGDGELCRWWEDTTDAGSVSGLGSQNLFIYLCIHLFYFFYTSHQKLSLKKKKQALKLWMQFVDVWLSYQCRKSKTFVENNQTNNVVCVCVCVLGKFLS